MLSEMKMKTQNSNIQLTNYEIYQNDPSLYEIYVNDQLIGKSTIIEADAMSNAYIETNNIDPRTVSIRYKFFVEDDPNQTQSDSTE